MATEMTSRPHEIRVPARLTADHVEDIAAALPGGSVELLLHRLHTLDVSTEARLMGLLARVRRSRSGYLTLRVHTGDTTPGLRPDSKYWELLTRRLVGAVLISHAGRVRKQDGEDLRSTLLAELRKHLADHDGLLKAGGRVAAPVLDGPAAASTARLTNLLQPSYPATLAFKDELARIVKDHLALPAIDFLRQTADFIRETLENAEQHGAAPWESDGPRDRLRYLSLRRFPLNDPHRQASSALPGAPIDRYIRSARENYGEDMVLVEINVVDDGLGIAATMSGSTAEIYSANLESEYSLVEHALTREGTSKNDPDAGAGLDTALKACRDVGGMFFVRSGRAFLWRDFLNRPGTPDTAVDRRSDRELPLLAGTSIGMLVPWTDPVLFAPLNECTSST